MSRYCRRSKKQHNNGHGREGRLATGSCTSGGLKALRLPDHFGAWRDNESNECAASIVLDRCHCGAGEDLDLCGARGRARRNFALGPLPDINPHDLQRVAQPQSAHDGAQRLPPLVRNDGRLASPALACRTSADPSSADSVGPSTRISSSLVHAGISAVQSLDEASPEDGSRSSRPSGQELRRRHWK